MKKSRDEEGPCAVDCGGFKPTDGRTWGCAGAGPAMEEAVGGSTPGGGGAEEEEARPVPSTSEPAGAVREEMVGNAVQFLKHPKVAGAGSEEKRTFLRNKGLTEAEIAEAERRAGVPAGVPGVGLVMLTMVLTQVGLPIEGIAIIPGVDRLMDMIRTAVNITGDAVVTTIVAKSEDKIDLDVFADPEAGVIEDEVPDIPHAQPAQ